MKNFVFIVLIFLTLGSLAQLPPTAQALYNEMYNTDLTRGQYATTNSAQALATADGNSFYLKWFPSGSTPSTTALMVTLHGSDGNAFNEFYLWHQKCAAKGIGIIALQWYRGAASVAPNDYFDDPTLYNYIDTALKRLKYPFNKAFLHGFSRGSARSFAIEYYDTKANTGKNYFCTILSNAGKPDSAYPLYNQINNNMYGHSLYNGKRWAMFCGGQDPNAGQSGCQGMNMAKNWVIANGGTVGLFISDPNAGHGGFHQTPAYIDSALNFYLPCYNGTASIKEQQHQKKLTVFPNPAQSNITIRKENHETVELKIFDVYGTLIENVEIKGLETAIDLSSYNKGIYLLHSGQQTIKIVKD